MNYLESNEQIGLIEYCNFKGYPYDLLFAIENEGKKTPQAGARAKAMGKRAGVCDLFFPYMRGGNGGLYIEMKSQKGKLSKMQKEFIDKMRLEGYKCEVCYSCLEAINCIESYMKGGI